MVLCTNSTLTWANRAVYAVASVFQLLYVDMTGLDGYQMMGATWYLSAMFLCMPLLYYLLLEKNTFFTKLGAPLVMLFCYGVLYKKYGAPIGGHDWNGFLYMGILRALAGLCLGCVCHRMCIALYEKEFTPLGQTLLTVLELGGYLAVFAVMTAGFSGSSMVSFAMLPVLAVSITISFSLKSYTKGWFQAKVGDRSFGDYMAVLSTAIYFTHARLQGFVIRVFPNRITFRERFVPYIMLSLVFGCLGVCFVILWNYGIRCYGKTIKEKFVTSKTDTSIRKDSI